MKAPSDGPTIDDMSIDALVYELIQKRFRTHVFAYIRERLRQELGDAWLQDVKTLFVREWDSISESHQQSKAGLMEGRQEIDDLDLLGVNQLQSLFQKWFDILIPESSIPSGRSAKQAMRSRFEGWLREVRDVRNPNAHPIAEDVTLYDALRIVDSTRRISNLLKLEDCAHSIEGIWKTLLRRSATIDPELSAGSPLLVSLPPREEVYDDFIGRTAELERLWAWFADDSAGRWVLVGEGGHGKSSVAHQFAATVAASNPDNLAAVLWLSAKRRRYIDAALLEIQRPDFVDLSSALDRVLRQLGWSSETAKTLDARRATVLELLDEVPCLLIADDLDSIPVDDEDVVEFFTYEVPKTATKVLMTSRRMYPGMSRSSTRISGLPREDAEEFLIATTQRLGLGDRRDLPALYNKICEVTERSPLYMEDLLRLCRFEKPTLAIDRWRQQKGDNARRYALERERELLSPVSRRILDACCLAGMGLSVAQLESILGLGEEAILGGLQELERSYLVPQAELVDDVPLFRAHRNLESWLRRQLRHDDGATGLSNAVSAVVGAKGSAASAADADVVRQVKVLLKAARGDEALRTAEQALSSIPNRPALLAARAEALASQRPARMVEARQDWERASQLGLNSAEAFLRWCSAEDAVSDWRRAADAAIQGIRACGLEHGQLNHAAGYALSRLGQMQKQSLDLLTAEATFRRAERHLRQALKSARLGGLEYRTARAYRALIINAQAMGDAVQVGVLAADWLRDYPNNQDARAEAQRQSGKPQVKAAMQELGLLPPPTVDPVILRRGIGQT